MFISIHRQPCRNPFQSLLFQYEYRVVVANVGGYLLKVAPCPSMISIFILILILIFIKAHVQFLAYPEKSLQGHRALPAYWIGIIAPAVIISMAMEIYAVPFIRIVWNAQRTPPARIEQWVCESQDHYLTEICTSAVCRVDLCLQIRFYNLPSLSI